MGSRHLKIILTFILAFVAGWLSHALFSRHRSELASALGRQAFLASDAKTGRHLGVVIGECRDWDGRQLKSYEVRLADGKVMTVAADGVKVYAP